MSGTTTETDLRRKLKVRMRPDLTITKQKYSGQTFHIVKDPVSLRYYRFRPEELFLLQQFDGRRTLEDVRHEFVNEFRPQRVSVAELEQFVRQLLQSGVASVDTPQLGQRLFERDKKRRRDKLKQTMLSFMYLKIPVFDPDRLLTGLLKYTRFLYTMPFFIMMLLFWTSALLLILVNFDKFVAKLPTFQEFFHLSNLIWLWGAIGIVKVLHEFSHGLSCKRFGGEVHEMGFMLLVFSPALYANVTDAWMLPSKWHRAIIGAAGIYIELIISAAAVWIWWFSEPGLLNYLCMCVVFVCSVSTVVFNGNPLMRFDGYYILADLLEVPNLRERSNKFLGNVASKLVFGAEAAPDSYAPVGRKPLFVTYAIAAYIYRWLVAAGILIFFHTFLKPYKLEIIGVMLGWCTAFSMIAMPCWQIVRTLRQRWRQMKVKRSRMTVGLTVAAALIGGVLLIPAPMRIDLPFILQPRGATSIFVQTAGQLARLRVKDGDKVAPGTVLAELENPELAKEMQKLRLEAALQERRLQASRGLGDQATAAEASVQFESIKERLKHLDAEMRKLVLRVPQGVEGWVIAPPRETDLGKTLQQGSTFCKIGDAKDLEAYVVVEHSDTSLFAAGARVWVKVRGHVGAIGEYKVERIAKTVLDDVPIALSNKTDGGPVPTTAPEPSRGEEASRRGSPEAPLTRSYAMMVPVPNLDGTLVPGLRGTARIDVAYKTLFWRLKRYFQQTFYFKM